MDSELQKVILQRQEANKEILKYIGDLVDRFPQQRFGQILSNYVLEGDKDPFYEESTAMLKRIKGVRE